MAKLVLIRHGQSEWNLQNRFTGWVDVKLTAEGEAQARKAGRLLAETGFAPNCAFTSVLTRAIRTLWLTLEEMDRVWIPVEKSWRLNERHYGGLTGLNKDETRAKHGDEQVKIWRRSFDVPPPALDVSDERHPSHDPRYTDLSPDQLPAAESLKLTLERVQPYWEKEIAPLLEAGEDVLVVAHGNSLRAIVKLLFQMSGEDIVGIEIPTGNPLEIGMDGAGKLPVTARYLDPDRAQPLPAIP
ncbi:2,3-diphosphoglycerate-dependent phosphoglycerate mutase [Hyphobacterium sp. HN65]|uniref:2,3-bisphosphoglycerate-dependent phosphoglycerate mutase n=1 Tax=Hyphobacterium lacteum TaxID=3116575 RepID=A0ABU7LPL6_9PROT|nr:2,3-diphosphoglycerate-dependent phosphoglycerate mutase [Hyphobacterium sp. HN65]MEE2525840.1 2,3-diphosphoglycerate-dependent phosphoglycerate mutase [Hyphobacterium sp. HN65]